NTAKASFVSSVVEPYTALPSSSFTQMPGYASLAKNTEEKFKKWSLEDRKVEYNEPPCCVPTTPIVLSPPILLSINALATSSRSAIVFGSFRLSSSSQSLRIHVSGADGSVVSGNAYSFPSKVTPSKRPSLES